MSSMKYRPEIDGLRTIAVIPVILFHMGAKWVPGGFLGVDVFFVISGYLITSIILKDYDRGSFNFTHFWLRRIRRILPALLIMLLTTSIAGYFIFYGQDIHDLGRQGVSALLSFANIYLWRLAGNYWGQQAENSVFLHTWSLSVEEQFYLFFPFFLIVLLKFYKKQLVSSIATLVIISFLLFLYGSHGFPNATFYLLPTRAWELGSGCLLAMVTHKYTLRTENNVFLSSIGLLIIILSYAFISGEGGISAYLIFPVIGSLLVLAFSKTRESIANRVLTVFPMVYIGKISYSLYIWHWPVIVMSKNLYFDGKTVFTPLYSTLLLFAISIASYHVIERTTRQRPKIIFPIFVCFVATMTLSLFLSTSDIAEDISAYSETTWDGQLYNVAPHQELPDHVRKKMAGIIVPVREHSERNYYTEGGITKLYNNEIPEVVILGDSHALMWSAILDEIVKELNVSISFYAAYGTPTFFSIPIKKIFEKETPFFSAEERYLFDKMRLRFLDEWKPKVVIIAVRWSTIINEQITHDLIDFLGKRGSKILFIEQPPELFFSNKNAPQYLAHMNLLPTQDSKKYIPGKNSSEYDKGLNLIRQISEKNAHCEIIPIADIFMNNNQVWVLDGSDVLYIDDDHLSHKGALKAKNRIKQILQSCLQS